jgi:hypothetical protein
MVYLTNLGMYYSMGGTSDTFGSTWYRQFATVELRPFSLLDAFRASAASIDIHHGTGETANACAAGLHVLPAAQGTRRLMYCRRESAKTALIPW